MEAVFIAIIEIINRNNAIQLGVCNSRSFIMYQDCKHVGNFEIHCQAVYQP